MNSNDRRHLISRFVCRWLLFGAVFTTSSLFAAAPSLDAFHPPGAAAGSEIEIQMSGKAEPWPPKIWVDDPVLEFQPLEKKGRFKVRIGAAAEAKPRLVRLYNDEGASAPRIFLVEKTPPIVEKEDNDHYAKPQSVDALPALIHGRLDRRGDLDSFKIFLEAGQTLIAQIDAYSLGSPIDALLHLRREDGFQVAFNHDFIHLDPRLVHQADEAGVYILQAMAFPFPANADVRFTGGDDCVYRLSLDAGPAVQYVLPGRKRADGSSSVQLIGWNLPYDRMRLVSGKPTARPRDLDILSQFRIQGMDSPVEWPLACEDFILEEETAKTKSDPQTIPVPCVVAGRMDSEKDEDSFIIQAEKGVFYEIQARSQELGFQMDPWVKILNQEGGQLERQDDHEGRQDPMIRWQAPVTGSFTVVVGNLFHESDSLCRYQLEIRTRAPAAEAWLTEHSYALEPGKEVEVKAEVERIAGFDKKLRLAVEGLPEGIRVEVGESDEKSKSVSLKLIAAKSAGPWQGPLKFWLEETETKERKRLAAKLSKASINNGVPQGYTDLLIQATPDIWLTILPGEEKEAGK